MRPFGALTIAFLVAAVWPAAGRADAPGPGAMAEKPGCHCPRPHRHIRHYVQHRRYWRPARVAVTPIALPYWDVPIPSPWDSAYDRAMVLHFRSPPVSGLYIAEPGYPPTPPIRPVQPYRFSANGAVYQYDGLSGVYVPLARPDAARAMAALEPLPPPPPPPPVR